MGHTHLAATRIAHPVARTAHVLMHEPDADAKAPVPSRYVRTGVGKCCGVRPPYRSVDATFGCYAGVIAQIKGSYLCLSSHAIHHPTLGPRIHLWSETCRDRRWSDGRQHSDRDCRQAMRHVNRVVIGLSEEKKSAVIYRDSPNQQGVPEIYWQCMLWAATELPVNNQIRGDRGADATGREPNENGLIFRALEIPPHIQDTKKVTEILQEVNKEVEQNHPPTAKDLARDPGMHRTDTCDMFVVAYGETYLVTDRDETLLKPGDSAVVQGVNHAWSSRSDKPCLIIGVNVHATPWPKNQYPAEGL